MKNLHRKNSQRKLPYFGIRCSQMGTFRHRGCLCLLRPALSTACRCHSTPALSTACPFGRDTGRDTHPPHGLGELRVCPAELRAARALQSGLPCNSPRSSPCCRARHTFGPCLCGQPSREQRGGCALLAPGSTRPTALSDSSSSLHFPKGTCTLQLGKHCGKRE